MTALLWDCGMLWLLQIMDTWLEEEHARTLDEDMNTLNLIMSLGWEREKEYIFDTPPIKIWGVLKTTNLYT